jgi:hypothetical protein
MLSVTGFVLAQDEDTFTTRDGRITVDYPADWFAEEHSQGVYIANTKVGIEKLRDGEDPQSDGEFMVNIVYPEFLEALNLEHTADPHEVVSGLIAALEAEGESEEYMGVLEPAAEAIVTGANIPGGEAYVLAIGFEEGTVLLSIQIGGDIREQQDTIDAIASSIVYTSAGVVMEDNDEGEEIRQWGSIALATSQYGSDSWSATQTTGEPDTDACGDYTTAWASSSSTGEDSILVEFDEMVIPTLVNIHQTYNPSSIVSVELSNTETGVTFELPDSDDPPGNTECPGVFTVEVTAIDTAINAVTIYLDQTIGGSWNEIDAVELVGTLVTDGDDMERPVIDANYDGEDIFSTVEDLGEFSFKAPEGWHYESYDGGFYLANTEDGLSRVAGSSGAIDGEVLIDIAMPTLLENLGLDMTADPETILTTLIGLIGIDGEVEPYFEVDVPAFTAHITGENVPNGEAWLYALEFDGGTLSIAVQIGDDIALKNVKPSIDEILGSMNFE